MLEAKVIFLIGGRQDGQATAQCDAYNIQTRLWTRMAPLNIPSFDHCACNYNDQYLYKFGGMNEAKRICQEVEQYDIDKNRWRVL